MSNENINKAKVLRIIAITALCVLFAATVTLAAALTVAVGRAREEEGKNAALAAMAQATPKNYTYAGGAEVVTLRDSYLGEISIPALEGVPKAAYDYDNLVFEDGRYKYVQDGFVTSYTGIDVSRHNGQIDWEAVAADGIDFAMIRCAYRGYSEGVINDDDAFLRNIEGALAAGLGVGVYFYSQAVDISEAAEEADYILEAIAPYEITYPVVIDIEITEAGSDGDIPRQNLVSGRDLTDIAAVFCSVVKDAGYTPMIYANLRMAYLKLDLRRLAAYDLWVSEWRDEEHDPSFYYDYQMWQYTSDAEVDGIEGDVSLNICFAHYEKLIED
jgi:GH25 family lysozyme M1 (1,4-beta-N-acetylmuramidase)